MPITRRDFLKAGLIVPVAASLPGGLAVLGPSKDPAIPPVVWQSCANGTCRSLPVEWARFMDWDIQPLPVGHEIDWPWEERANG